MKKITIYTLYAAALLMTVIGIVASEYYHNNDLGRTCGLLVCLFGLSGYAIQNDIV